MYYLLGSKIARVLIKGFLRGNFDLNLKYGSKFDI